MKQKDVALIIVIAFISGVVSFVVSTHVFVTPKNREQEVQTVDPIQPDFQPPDSKYFNSNAIDPTPNTSTGNSNNQDPFSNGN